MAIGKKMNEGLMVSCFMKYMVANEVAKILDILVPINITIRNSSLLDVIFLAHSKKRIFFCSFQTSICNGFADNNAISELEKIIEKNNPVIDKYKSNIIV